MVVEMVEGCMGGVICLFQCHVTMNNISSHREVLRDALCRVLELFLSPGVQLLSSAPCGIIQTLCT